VREARGHAVHAARLQGARLCQALRSQNGTAVANAEAKPDSS
jgi:hypothetical protein